MLTFDKSRVQIFDSFEIDFDLPKWKKRLKEGSDFMMYNNITNRNGFRFVTSGISLRPDIVVGSSITAVSGADDSSQKKKGFFERFLKKNRRRKEAEENQRLMDSLEAYKPPQIIENQNPQETEISVEEFFESIKNSSTEITAVKEKLNDYINSIEHFKKLGQKALYESMLFDVEIHRAEAQMFASNMKRFVAEDNVVKFAKMASKDLKLDWIKNFVRIIPNDVAEKKMRADELEIFDNYVIMSYDPEGKANQLTAEEKRAKEDPILFGVVIGSRKLYYIGDWIDEYCDLTIDDIVQKVGEGAIEVLK